MRGVASVKPVSSLSPIRRLMAVPSATQLTGSGETVTSTPALDTDGDFVKDSGEAIVDGVFQESVLRSAPYFGLRIDGITELN